MSNRWNLACVTPPTAEPVEPDELRTHARVYPHNDDVDLTRYITAARQYAETFCNRQFMSATWRLSIDFFPSWELKIPLPPIQSVSSITYVDTGGTTQTLSSSLYVTNADSQPGVVVPAYNQVWPISRLLPGAGYVKVTFVAGWTTAALVPATIKHAIKLIAAHLYIHREESTEEALSTLPLGACDLLQCERILDFSGPLGSSNDIPSAVSAWGGAR